MFDRANYALSDFLLFSDRVYTRLFELHNEALWPAHVLAALIGAYLLFTALMPRPARARTAFALLALVWLFVAVSFFWYRYATINWAAPYLVPVFLAMAIILAIIAVRPRLAETTFRHDFADGLAVAVLLFSLIGYPLLAIASGRSWSSAEVFAIAPDPTATATLACLALCRGALALAAMVIPVLWTIVTALTLYTLGSWDFLVAPFAAVLCLAAYAARQ